MCHHHFGTCLRIPIAVKKHHEYNNSFVNTCQFIFFNYYLFYILVAFSSPSPPPSPYPHTTAVSNPQYTPPLFLLKVVSSKSINKTWNIK